MARRRRPRLLAFLIAAVAASAMVACGGGSSLDIPTPTTVSTVAAQPTQAPVATPTTAPIATPTQETPAQQQYTIQAGDTLSGIANQFGVTVDAIVQANNITDPNLIVPGETLIIPAPAQ